MDKEQLRAQLGENTHLLQHLAHAPPLPLGLGIQPSWAAGGFALRLRLVGVQRALTGVAFQLFDCGGLGFAASGRHRNRLLSEKSV